MVVNDELVESPNILFITRRPNRSSNSKWLKFLPPDVVQYRRRKSQPRTDLLQSYINMPFQFHVGVWRSSCAIHMPNIRTPSLISRRCETHSDYSNFQPCLTFQPTSHPKNNRSPIERGFVSSLPQQGILLSSTDFQTQKLGYWVLATERTPEKGLYSEPQEICYTLFLAQTKNLSHAPNGCGK